MNLLAVMSRLLRVFSRLVCKFVSTTMMRHGRDGDCCIEETELKEKTGYEIVGKKFDTEGSWRGNLTSWACCEVGK